MRRALLLSISLLACFGPTPAARAGDGRADLFAAQDLERVDGDLEGALLLYRSAAGSEDPRVREPARLGEGRCLRRLGRVDEARTILEELVRAGPTPTVAAAATRELERIGKQPGEPDEPDRDTKALEVELQKARSEATRLREALDRASGSDEQISRLEAELGDKDALVRKLTARLRSLAAPGEDSRELAHRADLAAYALLKARALYREARFDEAREFVKRALEQEPTNSEARRLLTVLGDTLGERERLVREVLRLLDMERRIRLDDLRLQVDALISAGQELLLQGELNRSYARFSECIALIDAHPSFARELLQRRDRASEFLNRVTLRGGEPGEERPQLVRPDATPSARWRSTLRDLLVDVATSARPGGRELRIFDLTALDDRTSGDDPKPGALSQSILRPPPGSLFASLVPLLVQPDSWSGGGHLIRTHGDELVLCAPPDVLDGVADLLNRLEARQGPPTRLTLTVLAVDPSAVARQAATMGILFREMRGCAVAAFEDADGERLRGALEEGNQATVLGSGTAVVAPGRTLGMEHLRSMNLVVPPDPGDPSGVRRIEYGYKASFLPIWSGRDYGLAAEVIVRDVVGTVTLPADRGGDVQMPTLATEEADATVRLAPGRTLAIVGLSNPFRGREIASRSGLLLLVGLQGGTTGPAPAEPEPASPAVGRAHASPVDLGGFETMVSDDPAPRFRGESSSPSVSRTRFLLGRLREALGEELLRRPGVSFTIGGGVVWVRGGEAVENRVRSAVRRLLAPRNRLVGVRVRAACITAEDESLQFRSLKPGGRVIEGEGIRLFRLKGEERGRLAYFAAGTPGRISLLSGILAARHTQLVNLSKVTSFSHLRGIEEGSGPFYSQVDEGLAVEVRPVVLDEGRIDLLVSVRVARILAEGAIRTGSDGTLVEDPVQAVSSVRLRVDLAPDETLLITGIPAPTPLADRRERLMILIDAAVGMPK